MTEEERKSEDKEFEKTSAYFKFFLDNIDLWSRENVFYSPSDYDVLLAEELGLKFIEVDSKFLRTELKKWTLFRLFKPKQCGMKMLFAAYQRGLDPETIRNRYFDKFYHIPSRKEF